MQIPAGKAIHVDGIVQGVGFRPFVHNLAVKMGLTGDVYNSSQGVFIRIFGKPQAMDGFVSELRSSPPPLSSINHIAVEDLNEPPPEKFSILESKSEPQRSVAITPDANICADCRRELLDPADRRYRY
ncbi:MAG: acylphosphatase, partial [Planctomycetes bacterium]|nr:acylphosphatase [Planctomycetota bacterium]